jgi:anhydro-N-acetylmuramic acid kinase
MNPNRNSQDPQVYIGMMSGTSVDGLDACAVELSWEPLTQQGPREPAGKLHYQILDTASTQYPSALKQHLLSAMHAEPFSAAEFALLNHQVGQCFAELAATLCHKLAGKSICAIGTHGQTIFHQPPQHQAPHASKSAGYTWQIGDPSLIAAKTGLTTIADFRSADMAVGGQGAPLVPFADQLLFRNTHEGRCVQNIGGIGNVTVLPPYCPKGVDRDTPPVFAFDTGPGNMLIDAAMRHFYGKAYDAHGNIARQGQCHSPLLKTLMSDPYLQLPPPKSTGREYFGEPYFQQICGQFTHISPQDMIHTLTHFTAASIAHAMQTLVWPVAPFKRFIVGGGGTFNPVLIELIENYLHRSLSAEIEVCTHQSLGIPDQYKEALAFAILAWAHQNNIAANIPSCTGAKQAVILGARIQLNATTQHHPHF